MGDSAGNGSGWVRGLLSIVGEGSGLSCGAGIKGAEEVLPGITGLGGVDMLLGLLCPRGTRVLPLMMGADSGCWDLGSCHWSIHLMAHCGRSAGSCVGGALSVSGWDWAMGP